MLSAEEANKLFAYDALTGELHWAVDRGGMSSGSKAGYVNDNGYLIVSINNRGYRAHRLIWLIVNGSFPADDIDHINGIRTDNRIENLRATTRLENLRNMAIRNDNTSGCVGVGWDRFRYKWEARINLKGKKKYLGRYCRWWDAVCARKAAEFKIGFHANHGRLARVE